jgi:hypothetical protein
VRRLGTRHGGIGVHVTLAFYALAASKLERKKEKNISVLRWRQAAAQVNIDVQYGGPTYSSSLGDYLQLFTLPI